MNNSDKKPLEESIAKWILNSRLLVSIGSIFLLVLSGLGLQFLSVSTDQRIFFGPDNPQLIAFDKVEETFSEINNIMFIIDVKKGKVFSEKNYAALEALTEEAWQTPYSYRVDSVNNYQHTQSEGDDLIVGSLSEFLSDGSQTSYDYLEKIALSDDFVAQRLISLDGKVAGLNVQLKYPKENPDAVAESVSFSRELQEKYEAQYPDLKIYLTGSSMINVAMMEAAFTDLRTVVPAMYVVVIVLLMVLLRSIVSVLATVIVIALSVASAMGVSGFLGVVLTPPSISSVTVIMTITVAHCVHLLVAYFQQLRLGLPQKDAMYESLRINIMPIFLTSITTMIGFLSLNISDVPPMQDFGNIVAAGCVFAFCFSLGVLPLIICSLPQKPLPKRETESSFMDHFANFVIRYQNILLISILSLGVLITSFAPNNVINDRFSKYFSEDIEFRVASDFADETLAGLYSIEYVLNSGKEYGISDPAYLKLIDDYAIWLRQQPEVKHVSVFTDIMKRLNKNMHGDDEAFYKLPDSKELAAQYLLLYEMSLPYGLDLNTLVNQSKSATRLTASTPSLTTSKFIALQERATEWQKQNMPEYMHFEGASISLMFTHIGFRAMSSSIKGAVIALILISLILLFALRSVRLGLISFIPNLLPAGVGFGVWALTNGNIGLSLSSVLGITMGIVVDDTVHFLSKYKRALKEDGLSQEEAIRYAFHNVGVALWVTTFVLSAGFLLLSFSVFKPNGDMGLMAAIIILVALVLDFLLLPPLLLKFAKNA